MKIRDVNNYKGKKKNLNEAFSVSLIYRSGVFVPLLNSKNHLPAQYFGIKLYFDAICVTLKNASGTECHLAESGAFAPEN